jgi:hypothetical protein
MPIPFGMLQPKPMGRLQGTGGREQAAGDSVGAVDRRERASSEGKMPAPWLR